MTVTDIVLQPNVEATYGYDEHLEIAYCIEGTATLRDQATGEAFEISPGVMWVAEPGSRFSFRATAPTRLICVFQPPFKGGETGFASDGKNR